jgi:hypothetical protein
MMNMKDLEAELLYIESQSYITPFSAFMKIKKALAQHNFSIDDTKTYFDLLDTDSTLFYQIQYPGDYDENPIYLTVDFYIDDENGMYKVDIAILTDEEMQELIGDGEVLPI